MTLANEIKAKVAKPDERVAPANKITP